MNDLDRAEGDPSLVAITDLQVATLRAQLAGETDEHRRLLGELDPARDSAGYGALLTGAFIVAAERRFGEEPHRGAVIEFIGDLRSRSADIAEELPAEVGERFIMTALGHESVDDLDDSTKTRCKVLITVGLVGDEQLADEGLDAFLADARESAEKLVD